MQKRLTKYINRVFPFMLQGCCSDLCSCKEIEVIYKELLKITDSETAIFYIDSIRKATTKIIIGRPVGTKNV